MHNLSKQGISIKVNKSNQGLKSREQNKTVDKEMAIEIKNNKTVTVTVAVKDKLIEEKIKEITKLQSENKSLTEQNMRISRCARKMDQEIKVVGKIEDLVHSKNYCIARFHS